MTYDAYLRSAIFRPLGMTSTANGHGAQDRAAVPYTGHGTFSALPERLSLDLYYGAGSIVSTAHDMARWDAALLRGALLSPGSRRDLWSPGHLSSGDPVPYAMGFVPATVAGHREVWHNGLSPFAGGYCYNAIFPDDDLAVVVLTNAGDFQGPAGPTFAPAAEALVRDVLDAYVSRPAPSSPEKRASASFPLPPRSRRPTRS